MPLSNHFRIRYNHALLLCVTFLLCNCKQTFQNEKKLSSISLTTPENTPFLFSEIKNRKATVFIFLKPDCPLSQNYTLTLNTLYQKFKSDTILFVGIIPAHDVSNEEAADYISRYKIIFPVVMDTKNQTVNYFKATRTPEVFVVDAGENILYKGAIDNWAISIGKHRTVITENYLQEALDKIKHNLPAAVKETKAVGCVIEKIN